MGARIHVTGRGHLTATNRSTIAHMMQHGLDKGASSRLFYALDQLGPGKWRVAITSRRSDDWGRMVHDRRTVEFTTDEEREPPQPFPIELTPAGEQYCVPGTERQPKPGKPAQLDLWG